MDRGAWRATVHGVAKSRTDWRDLAHKHPKDRASCKPVLLFRGRSSAVCLSCIFLRPSVQFFKMALGWYCSWHFDSAPSVNSRARDFLGLWASSVRHAPPSVVVIGLFTEVQIHRILNAVKPFVGQVFYFFMSAVYVQVDYKGMLKMSANEWATNRLVLLIEMHFQIL